MMNTNRLSTALLGVSLFALNGCERDRPVPVETPAAAASPQEKVSIFRPEAEIVPIAAPLSQMEASIPFAQDGALTGAAMAQLAAIAKSAQMQLGGKVILRGHTDSVGSDAANQRVSRQRAEIVRDHLVASGIADDRIEIIALGEMRPIAPNAKLDGSPDEEGRAANRRVEVTIVVAQSPAAEAGPGTLVEAIAKPD